MKRRVLPCFLGLVLLLGCLSLAPTTAVGDTGDCQVEQTTGHCQKDGAKCTVNNKAGKCKSETAFSKGECVCKLPEEKKGGGTLISLAVFLALLLICLGFRGSKWLRRAETR